MSTSGLSGKSHGEKSAASSGKKFQAVNINSVYSGKSLVGQKASAAPRHGGLQSLGKATAVARRMPPPANLPSIKAESAGQDQSVNIVPSGVTGWGTQQQSTTLQDHQPDAKPFSDLGNKKIPADGISLRPSGGVGGMPAAGGSGAKGTATMGGSSGTGSVNAAAQGTAPSGRPTWSTRIGTSNNSGSFFAAQSAQDYPKLSSETEPSGDAKLSAATPSLRPQKSGNWKSGGGHGMLQGNESPARSENGQDRSRSLSPPPHHRGVHQVPHEQPPSVQQSHYGPRQGMYPPPGAPPYPGHQSAYPHYPYPPTLYPPAPGGHRGAAGGAPPYPQHVQPHYPMQQDYRYGHQGATGNVPPPHPPMMPGRGGPMPTAPPGHGKPSEERPPEHYRGGPPPAQRSDEFNQAYGGNRGRHTGQDRNYGQAPDERGDRWTHPSNYPAERDPRYREGAVWSDDENDDRGDRRYNRPDSRRNKGDKPQAWSDSEDRYGEGEWTRNAETREPVQGQTGRGVPPNMRMVHGYPPPHPVQAGMKMGPYGGPPPSMGPVTHGHGRENRYGQPMPPMPMHQRQFYGGYMPPFDQRHAPPVQPQHMGYGQHPHHYGRGRGTNDIEAEEEEEIARQQQQQFAREAAIERSKQKRRLGQQTSVSSGTVSEHMFAGDGQYAGGDARLNDEYDESEPERCSSRGSHGNKPTNRRQPEVPPRFARHGDPRSFGPTAPQTQYVYRRSPQQTQHDSAQAYFGHGDAGYYEKRSPRQPGTEQYQGSGYYDPTQKFDNAPRHRERRRLSGSESELRAANQESGRRDNHNERGLTSSNQEKPLKRAASKESLSSNSDRSSNKGEKNSGSSISSSVVRGGVTWPKENTTVKEEDDYSSAKLADIEDNDEDQRFETLSKPKVVVKRTVGSASVEKPTEQVTPASPPKEEPTAPPSSSTVVKSPKSSRGNEDSKIDGKAQQQTSVGHKSNQQTHQQQDDNAKEAKKNVWEQRKEEFENKRETSIGPKDDQFSSSTVEETVSGGGRGETEQDENWAHSSGRGRGRGLGRGRGRREFVSSRRLHGHSLGAGGAGRRGRNWDDTGAYGRRRGGSVGYTGEQQTKPKRYAEEKMEKERKEESKVEDVEEGAEKVDKKKNKENTEEVEQEKQHGATRSTRGRGPRGMRGGVGSSGRGGSDQDWNGKSYGGGSAVFSRSRGGGHWYNDWGYDEGGYGEEEGYDFSYGRYGGDGYSRGGVRRGRGVTTRGYRAVPPRFQDHDRTGGYGSSGHRQHYGGGRGGTGRSRDAAAQSTKAPSGVKRENQSEGNDEWETASESSDVGERYKNDGAEADSIDKKKHLSSGPKSFSSQRRATDRRRGGGGSSGSGNVVHGSDWRSGNRRHYYGDNGRDVSDTSAGNKTTNTDCSGSGGFLAADQNISSGSKNAVVASHQMSSSGADAKISNQYTAQSTNKRSQRKDEKPAPKPGALATVDINNIAGVVVIDDHPDNSATLESHDGFQEVISKKRLKKDVQQSFEEKDRKSQSPSSRRMQPHFGSGGNGSGRIENKSGKKGSGANAPASVSKNASARSSSGDAGPIPASSGARDRRTPSTSSASASSFPTRQFHGMEQQTYRSEMDSVQCVLPTSTTIAVPLPTANVTGSASSIPSKTGCEIWGTPDPMPFSGANEQPSANKCVARPARGSVADVAGRPKSVEFIADSLNKASDDGNGVKLDFTFDASLGPFRDPKQTDVGDPHDSMRHGHVCDLDLDNNGENSPSADQLSEKIASVKKVWDGVQSSMGDMDENTNQKGNASSFFSGPTDAETAAIVSSAASLVSAAVLQSVGVAQVSPPAHGHHGHHVSGYDGEGISKVDPTGAGQSVVSVGSSSKMEGPNVAKVRPQQMLMDHQGVSSGSHIVLGQDEFGGNGVSMNMGYPSGSPTPLYAFTGGSNSGSLLLAQFTAKGDFGLNAAGQSPMPSYAPFPMPTVSTRQAAYMLPSAPAVSQPMEMPFGGLIRNTPIGGADQGILFGAAPAAATYVSQQVRSHSTSMLPNQQSAIPKQSTVNVFGNLQGSFVLQDGGVSLFSHPPPSFGSLAAPQAPPNAPGPMVQGRPTGGPNAPQPASSPGGFDFSQPPPTAPPVSVQQPPPLGPPPTVLQTRILQAATNIPPPPTKIPPNFPNLTASGPAASFGWGASLIPQQQKPPAPSMLQGARKGFNPTIGPPNSQKVKPGGPGLGVLNLFTPGMPVMGHMFNTAPPLGPTQPLAVATSAPLVPNQFGGAGGNFGRRSGGGVGGATLKCQNVNVDQSKRDGDLLQQMDKFINSTGDEESNAAVDDSNSSMGMCS